MIRVRSARGVEVQISEANMARLIEAAQGNVANVTDVEQGRQLQSVIDVLNHDLGPEMPESDLCWGLTRGSSSPRPCR